MSQICIIIFIYGSLSSDRYSIFKKPILCDFRILEGLTQKYCSLLLRMDLLSEIFSFNLIGFGSPRDPTLISFMKWSFKENHYHHSSLFINYISRGFRSGPYFQTSFILSQKKKKRILLCYPFLY